MNEHDLTARFPAAIEIDAQRVSEAFSAADRTLIVLDDDPTGTQSVADLPVLTRWEVEDFAWAFERDAPAVYVLTNTRSLDPVAAADRNREVVRNALAAADGRRLDFVSRGDSTLRGHFPLETDVIAEELAAAGAGEIDGVVIVPAFPDAGRVTIGGVHYMRDGDALTPIADTEFAGDSTFGYRESELARWVEEKAGGRDRAEDVIVLDLGIIRAGADAIAAALAEASDRRPVVADAVDEDDLRALALGLDRAERAGKRLLYRVGPPFVRARIGQRRRAPLTATEAYGSEAGTAGGGLIVVGSHVGLTSRQLAVLRAQRPGVVTFELDVDRIMLGAESAHTHLDEIADRITAALADGDVVVHTSRTLVRTDDPDESLEISRRVSAAVVDVVRRTLERRAPRFVVAKGGITSSDVASHGLEIRRAIVRGPMLPGIVSLWEPADGPATGIPYIVFAGNVGTDDSLARVVDTLTASPVPAGA
ncbi:four-carbon acid sugar kinase family protein [Agromyces sp. LHK192]|uniref:four-carbon acid sugar kinase family protein n=1 Tax=Agromyces sp. LHK192 TaxID=2498704 RepID=UPI000FD74158|nr:four-carbon acid sugar kinase family protein [Agromyces sp. LHK192]